MDREIAKRLRTDHYEQYVTLVRMHLSFELDLNTDDNEVLLSEKLKSRKRFNFHKKTKGCVSSKSTSPPTTGAGQPLSKTSIVSLKQLIEFLVQEKNITQEGIFRRTGAVSRQNDLKNRITLNESLDLTRDIYTVHDCASVLKALLADLSEPLLTDALFPAYCQTAEIYKTLESLELNSRETRLLHSLQLLYQLLPDDNRTVLEDLLLMLNKTIQYETNNKMSADSLATLFTPHLICPRKLQPEALHQISQNLSGVISFMIARGTLIFDIPPKLATDIRANFAERKRKKTMSPAQILDESVTSDSTANTVYTFCDRERTAEAHSTNPTDTALAQLYAHIQSLPESGKKRKLIKQFNKENGHGTPLQMQIMNRLKHNASTIKSGKSLGDSIKKHIFQKSLISKTPKPPETATATSTPTFNTPSRVLGNPKTRVLFQSPLYLTKNNDSILQSSFKYTQLTKDHVPSPLRTLPSTVTSEETSNLTRNLDKSDDHSGSSLVIEPIDSFIDKPSQTKSVEFSSNIINVMMVESDIDDDVDYHSDDDSINQELRYKSEPNLSTITNQSIRCQSIFSSTGGRFIANKLLKGVSMINLRERFSDDQKFTRKIDETENENETEDNCMNDTVEDNVENNSTLCQTIQLNDDVVYCTPNTITNKRHSVSPITKSTQRMSKAMQESIMTPRSRKPVMLLRTNICSSSEQTHILNSSFTSLHEEDEDTVDEVISANKLIGTKNQRWKSHSAENLTFHNSLEYKQLICEPISSTRDSLTTPFRRSVLTASPVDSSFSSHPDDFCSTTDMDNLSESEMTDSLLYCLNGNTPEGEHDDDKENGINRTCDNGSKNPDINRLSFVSTNFDSRKRSVDGEGDGGQPLKKLLSLSQSTGERETSL